MQTSNLARWFLAFLFGLSLFPAFAANPAERPENPEADELTEALVRGRLAADDLAPYHRIDVRVVAGVATVRGTARTRQAHNAILREVEKVSGVLAVRDHIEVQPNP